MILLPDRRQLYEARFEGFWLGSFVWIPIGALAGWLVHALVSGAAP